MDKIVRRESQSSICAYNLRQGICLYVFRCSVQVQHMEKTKSLMATY